jgi:predicted RND superfamily exporter protein
VQATSPVDTSYGLFNANCSAMPIIVFSTDHKAGTITTMVNAVKKYNAENANPQGWRPPDDPDKAKDWKAPEPGTPEFAKGPYIEFSLATGNVGVMAATNEVIKAQEKPILIWVYVAIALCCWLAFRSIPATICVMLPLILVSLMAYGVMAMMGIGLKVATLPVAAFAVGIGVDYGIYIYSTLSAHMSEGVPLKEAYFRALHYTGKAVLFTALTLASGVATWLMSDLQFQADMGALLVFMFVVNMLGAILLFPALAHFLLEGRKITATLAH